MKRSYDVVLDNIFKVFKFTTNTAILLYDRQSVSKGF